MHSRVETNAGTGRRGPDIFGNPRAVYQRLSRPLRVAAFGAAALLGVATHGHAADAGSVEPTFAQWLAKFRGEASAAGISGKTLNAALADQALNERVIELDRQQPESVLTFEEYLAKVVPDHRIATGREKLRRHGRLLAKIGTEYGVPPRVIVALWGVETDFGRLPGNFSIVNSLATLAYEGRRADLFRGELLEALRILDDGDVTVRAMRGSWAGAMGQVQFMPSTFRRYAVDFNGDGKRDIWNSRADALASAANYLAQIGWVKRQSWGREVAVPAALNRDLIGLEQRKTLAEWHKLGVRRKDGGDLPKFDLTASLIQPSNSNGRAFLVYDNFRVIMQWNRSTYFGTAVGLLADGIGGTSEQ